MPDHEHIRISVEVNLFFQRIMKEHLFFLQTNLQPAAHKYIEKANTLKNDLNSYLTKRYRAQGELYLKAPSNQMSLLPPIP